MSTLIAANENRDYTKFFTHSLYKKNRLSILITKLLELISEED